MALAITDPRNLAVPKGLAPLAVGFVVVALTTAFEFNCGAALNPARDLGPRLFTLVGGWGAGVFRYVIDDKLILSIGILLSLQ